MHEKTIVTNPISDFSNVSKSNDDSSIDCAATTPMRSCTIEYQAGHRPLCMWILNTIVKGVLESYIYSFRVFFLESKEFSACSHSILQRACTKPALEVLHEDIIGWSWLWARYYPFFLSWAFVHLYSDARGKRRWEYEEERAEAVCKMGISQLAETEDIQSIHLCFYSGVFALMGYMLYRHQEDVMSTATWRGKGINQNDQQTCYWLYNLPFFSSFPPFILSSFTLPIFSSSITTTTTTIFAFYCFPIIQTQTIWTHRHWCFCKSPSSGGRRTWKQQRSKWPKVCQ